MFENIAPGNVKATMRVLEAVSADLWQVNPKDLVVLDGFNVRIKNAEYWARVRQYADSMKAEGFFKHKPLAGYVMADKRIAITDGHTRHDALTLANSELPEGMQITSVPLVVSVRGTTIEDLTAELVTANSGEKLTMYEASIVCKRLAAFGWDSKRIAARLKYSSAQYVDDLIMLAGAALAIRRMVEENILSATTAIATIKKHGADAADVLTGAITGGKVTAKHIPDQAFRKVIKKNAKSLYDVVTRIKLTPAFTKLPDELQADVLALLWEIDK